VIKVKINSHIVTNKIDIKKAIKKINSVNPPILFVNDSNGIFLGTISDGDIRRFLLKEKSLQSNIKEAVNTKPIFCNANELMSKANFYEKKLINNSLKGIPIIENKKIIKAFILKINPLKKNQTPIMIMAGGKGSRLLPITKNIPKPLIKINNKPMIQFIIDKIVEEDFENLYISINHLGNQIIEYVNSYNKFGLNIKFIIEKSPLGTAGSLSLIKKKNIKNLIVINADVITSLKYEKLLNFHQENRNEITIAGVRHKYQVPFGSIHAKNQIFKNIIEKPVIETLVNAGIYVISIGLIKKIKKNKFLSMVDLINSVSKAKKIGIFPMHEEWLDIGNKENLMRAKKNIKIYK